MLTIGIPLDVIAEILVLGAWVLLHQVFSAVLLPDDSAKGLPQKHIHSSLCGFVQLLSIRLRSHSRASHSALEGSEEPLGFGEH